METKKQKKRWWQGHNCYTSATTGAAVDASGGGR
jgi:hypothetical protein